MKSSHLSKQTIQLATSWDSLWGLLLRATRYQSWPALCVSDVPDLHRYCHHPPWQGEKLRHKRLRNLPLNVHPLLVKGWTGFWTLGVHGFSVESKPKKVPKNPWNTLKAGHAVCRRGVRNTTTRPLRIQHGHQETIPSTAAPLWCS